MRFGLIAAGGRESVILFDGEQAFVAPSPIERSMVELLRTSADGLRANLVAAAEGSLEPVDLAAEPLKAPISGQQEVWASGVTYERSLQARVEESIERSVYDRVYEAKRPELFLKAPAYRVVGPGEPVGIRSDSEWNVPEPELALVVNSRAEIVGYTLGNDMSSRSIEGENPLYLPQAKIYDRSCSLGPWVLPSWELDDPGDLTIRIRVERGSSDAFVEDVSVAKMRRPPNELVENLFRSLSFPDGVIILTGTGIVPDQGFTLRDGDVVRISCEQIGTLENNVIEV